jgi:DNA-directed RNA polymerase specialized sigma24 family protein
MKSYNQIYTELKKLSSKIPACYFIPYEDKKDIVSESMEKIYKLYLEGKLKDDFNEIKGYNFIIIRNMCFAYKKRKKIINFVEIIDDTLNDIFDDITEKDEDYEIKKEIILEHSRYYKFTPVQRTYIELALTSNQSKEVIKEVLTQENEDIFGIGTGIYHKLRGRKNKKYKYKVYNIENPNEYFLYETTHSVMKDLGIDDWRELKQIIENETIYNNNKIEKYENKTRRIY